MGYQYTLKDGKPEMTFNPDATIATDLLFSALVRQNSFFLDPGFGLDLAKKNNPALIADSYKAAAKWLIDTGKAKSVDVTAEPDDDDKGRVNVLEKARQANDEPATFETFVGVI